MSLMEENAVRPGEIITCSRNGRLWRKVSNIDANADVEYMDQDGKTGKCSLRAFRTWASADKY